MPRANPTSFSLLCHSIHCFILIQHLRMILLLNLYISQQLAYTTIAEGKYIIIVCSLHQLLCTNTVCCKKRIVLFVFR